jgi:hypothetical protein
MIRIRLITYCSILWNDIHTLLSSISSYQMSGLTDIDYIKRWTLDTIVFDCPETTTRELKEIRPFSGGKFKEDLDIEESLRRLFEENDLEMLSDCEQILHTKLKHYIPKYYATFINTICPESDFAELIFGVADDGRVTGVLMPTNIDARALKDIVWSMIEKTINLQDGGHHLKTLHKRMRKFIKVELIDLPIDSGSLEILNDTSESFLHQQKSKNDKFKEDRHNYKKARDSYIEIEDRFKQNLESMINHDEFVYPQLLEFIETYDPPATDCTYYKTLYHTPLGQNDLIRIRNDMIQVLKDTRIDPQKHVSYRSGQVTDEKTDLSKFAYWVTQFRDIIIRNIQIKRSQIPLVSKRRIVPPYTALMLTNPIKRIGQIMQDDAKSQLKYAIIRIVFPTRTVLNRITYSGPGAQNYFTYNVGNIKKMPSRQVDPTNGPACVEINITVVNTVERNRRANYLISIYFVVAVICYTLCVQLKFFYQVA